MSVTYFNWSGSLLSSSVKRKNLTDAEWFWCSFGKTKRELELLDTTGCLDAFRA